MEYIYLFHPRYLHNDIVRYVTHKITHDISQLLFQIILSKLINLVVIATWPSSPLFLLLFFVVAFCFLFFFVFVFVFVICFSWGGGEQTIETLVYSHNLAGQTLYRMQAVKGSGQTR